MENHLFAVTSIVLALIVSFMGTIGFLLSCKRLDSRKGVGRNRRPHGD